MRWIAPLLISFVVIVIGISSMQRKSREAAKRREQSPEA